MNENIASSQAQFPNVPVASSVYYKNNCSKRKKAAEELEKFYHAILNLRIYLYNTTGREFIESKNIFEVVKNY